MPKIASKIDPTFVGPVLDADRLAEGPDALVLRAKERARLNALDLDFSNPDLLFSLLDNLKRVVAQIDADSTAHLKVAIGAVANGLVARQQNDGLWALELGSERGTLPVGNGAVSSAFLNPDVALYTLTSDLRVVQEVSPLGVVKTPGQEKFYNPDVAFYLLTSDGRVVTEISPAGLLTASLSGGDVTAIANEMAAARGPKATLAERLAVTARPDGVPLGERLNMHNLSATRSRLGDLLAGTSLSGALGEPYQLVINLIGNSWFDSIAFMAQRFSRIMKAALGDAGSGFIGVVRGGDDPSRATIAHTGSWTTINGATANSIDVPAPHILSISSSTPGDKIRVTQVAGSGAFATTTSLLALPGGAVVSVSKNGGAGTEMPVSALSTNLNVALAAGDYLEVTVVSGTFTAYGFDLRNNAKGVRINKFGASSARWSRFLAANEAAYIAGLATMPAHLTIMMEGVNGVYDYSAAQEVANTSQMIGRVRAANPLTDILLVSPPMTLATNATYSLADYAYALRGFAAQDGMLAYLDLQYAFGPSGTYGDSGRQYFTTADVNHPGVNGRPIVADALRRAILFS